MKTQDKVNESLWELWNAPLDGAVIDEDKLLALHKAIGSDSLHRKRPVYIASAMASAFAVVCVFLSVALLRQVNVHDEMANNTVSVSAGIDGPANMVLPDGTSVVLNARSSISYNTNFGESDRCVVLEGQGYFDVVKNPEKAFVVQTPNMKITVHGTKFNVYAYPERKIDEVSLVEGSVSVESGGNEFKMRPGEKVLYDKATGGTSLKKTDNRLETAWLGKELYFNHNTLETVFDALERRFGVTIKPAQNMDLSDIYTGSFTDRNLSDIMNILKIHYGFNYYMEENVLVLK